MTGTNFLLCSDVNPHCSVCCTSILYIQFYSSFLSSQTHWTRKITYCPLMWTLHILDFPARLFINELRASSYIRSSCPTSSASQPAKHQRRHADPQPFPLTTSYKGWGITAGTHEQVGHVRALVWGGINNMRKKTILQSRPCQTHVLFSGVSSFPPLCSLSPGAFLSYL